MRLIDADRLHEDMQIGIECEAYDKPFDYIAEILDAPTIATKQVEYYDEDEKVWKIGEVIVDE